MFWREKLVCDDSKDYEEKIEFLKQRKNKRAYALGIIRMTILTVLLIGVLIFIKTRKAGLISNLAIGSVVWIIASLLIYFLFVLVNYICHRKDNKTVELIKFTEEMRILNSRRKTE